MATGSQPPSRPLPAATDARAARRAVLGARPHERKQNQIAIIAASLAVATVLIGGFYYAVMPSFSPSEPPSAAEPTAAARATDTFNESRTGKVVFMPQQGNVCRQVQFNNETGRFGNEREVPCDQAATRAKSIAPRPAAPPSPIGSSYNSFRDLFVKR